jgi:hypothetical protein
MILTWYLTEAQQVTIEPHNTEPDRIVDMTDTDGDWIRSNTADSMVTLPCVKDHHWYPVSLSVTWREEP